MPTTTIKILSIDPGIHHTGWSISSTDATLQKLTVSTWGEIQASDIAKREFKSDVKLYGSLISLFCYEAEIQSLMEKYTPDFVVSEDAFYNPRMPNAFLSLKLCINAIQRILFKHHRKLYTIPPTVAKQAVYGKGTANKSAVQESIQILDDLVIKTTKAHPISSMVEHEADSIAIGYAFFKLTLPELVMQQPLKN